MVVIPPRPTAKTCPLQLIMKDVVVRDSAFLVNPFLLIRSNGYIPSRGWFMRRLKDVFGNKITGHSLRAGGAAAYTQSGVRMEVVQRMGRWKSDTFKTYIQGHPLLNLIAAQQQAPFASQDPGRGLLNQATDQGSLNDCTIDSVDEKKPSLTHTSVW